MDRQHPRDCFDVKLMYERFGMDPQFVECFVPYLIGHPRPLHEVIFPTVKDISQVYEGEFLGMTMTEVALEDLLQVRARLMHELPRALTDRHRAFLLSFVALEPDWTLLQQPDVQTLPAVRWKLENLTKLRKARPDRFAEQASILKQRLEAAPHEPATDPTGEAPHQAQVPQTNKPQ